MQGDPGTWKPHLDALQDEATAIGTAVQRFEALRGYDLAWALLSGSHKAVVDEAGRRECLPFDMEDWGVLVGQARMLAHGPGVPDGAARAARRVLDEDTRCREVRREIAAFLDGARAHGDFWDGLQDDRTRRARVEPDVATIDLPDYRPLTKPERTLRKNGRTLLDDEARYGPHLARVPEDREAVRRALERLDAHDLLDRCTDVSKTLRKTARAAVGRGVALSDDAPCRKARRQARGLAGRVDVEGAMRRRLETGLAEQADLAVAWQEFLRLAHETAPLAREHGEICEEAARRGVPRPLAAGWRDWEARARAFVDAAAWALHGAGALRGWRGLTDLPARVGNERERMTGRIRLPAHEDARLDRMLEAEAARLRDPEAGHGFGHEWWGQEPLAAGDRLELARWRDGSRREAVVVWPGVDGGCAPGARVALQWAGADGTAEWVAARELAGSGVRRASWSDERLRDVALARGDTAPSGDFSLDCRNGLVAGDRVRWIEIGEARGAADGPSAGPSIAVTVEAEVEERSVAAREEEDRCRLRETWRSDGAALGQPTVPFDLLMAGGAMCAFGSDWEKRERRLREQEVQRRIVQEVEALKREWSIGYKVGLP